MNLFQNREDVKNDVKETKWNEQRRSYSRLAVRAPRAIRTRRSFFARFTGCRQTDFR
jgi:hypothetical protein